MIGRRDIATGRAAEHRDMRCTLTTFLACAALIAGANGAMFQKAALANQALSGVGGLPNAANQFTPPGPLSSIGSMSQQSQFMPPGISSSGGSMSQQGPFAAQGQLGGGIGNASTGEQIGGFGTAENPSLNVIDLSARRAQNDALVLGSTAMVNASTFHFEMPPRKGDLVIWKTRHGQSLLCVFEGEDLQEIPNQPDSFAAQVVLTNCKKYSKNPNSLTVVKFGGTRFPNPRIRSM